MRRVPIVPTVIVAVAVAIMIGLGFWQIARLHAKEAMLARYTAAQGSSAQTPFPFGAAETENALYHRSTLDCVSASDPTSRSGRNAKGDAGIAQFVTCHLVDGKTAELVLGVAQTPALVAWNGGKVTGWIASGPRLVADPPQARLAANARPDPNDIANNHLAYAVQWFFFAIVAVVIYVLALRKRDAGSD